MDILKPELMWIKGRCYRIPVLDPNFDRMSGNRDQDLENETGSINESEIFEDDCQEIPQIKSLTNGRLKMVFPIARVFLPFIIGAKGNTVRRISNKTACTILTPKFHEQQNITIYGSKKEKVILAWRSILCIIKSSRKKLTATHFVSIPLNGEEIKNNFLAFKEEVLSTCSRRGICENLFQDPDKLHLTVLVCTLIDNNERNLAETHFHDVCENFVRPLLQNYKPCILEMEGLDYMNDDPTEVNILYANVKIVGEDGLLQELCDEILVTFQALGVAKEDCVRVKIHVTLMNTSYLSRTEGDAGEDDAAKKSNNSNESFDATEVLKRFRNFYFGQQELKSIHLSTRFTVDENGYYKYIAKMDL